MGPVIHIHDVLEREPGNGEPRDERDAGVGDKKSPRLEKRETWGTQGGFAGRPEPPAERRNLV